MKPLRKLPVLRRLGPLAVAVAALVAAPPAAKAQDDAYRALAKRYEELAKNHDDEASRERRYVLLDLFPYRTEKACRKLLKDALDDEKTVDNRVAVVHLLTATGEPKDLDIVLSELKKEKLRAPVIAIGEGLGFTPEAGREDMTVRVLKHLGRAKDDLRLALIEGLGGLAHPKAVEALLELSKLTPEEQFERNIALGACGGEAVVGELTREAAAFDPVIRLGAALGLEATASEAGFEALRALLSDPDTRVVGAAARALASAGRKEAAGDLAKSLGGATTLRAHEDLRAALRELLGQDLGYDSVAWGALAAGEKPGRVELPTLAPFFGAPVASDMVVGLIDTSRSMEWMGRLEQTCTGVADWIRALPDDTAFQVVDTSRSYEPFRETLMSGAENRAAAAVWTEERLTRRSIDMKQGLVETLNRFPDVDTIVIATDSHPWGSSRGEQSRETLEVFRRLNRTRRVRLVVALVMPGGRYEPSERTEAEIEERIQYLTELAEDSGGTFIHVTE